MSFQDGEANKIQLILYSADERGSPRRDTAINSGPRDTVLIQYERSSPKGETK